MLGLKTVMVVMGGGKRGGSRGWDGKAEMD